MRHKRRAAAVRGGHQSHPGPDPGRPTAEDRSSRPCHCRGRRQAHQPPRAGLLLFVKRPFTNPPAESSAQTLGFPGLAATRRAFRQTRLQGGGRRPNLELRTRKGGQKGDSQINLCSQLLCKSLVTNGASGRTRTCNLLIRSQKLYPIELRTHSRHPACGQARAIRPDGGVKSRENSGRRA